MPNEIPDETIEEVREFLRDKLGDTTPFHLQFLVGEGTMGHISNVASPGLPHFIASGLSGMLESELVSKTAN